MVSPTLTAAPGASRARSAPRTTATSPTASTTLPACANAEPVAARQASSIQQRDAERSIGFIVRLLSELVTKFHAHDAARIFVERNVRGIARVLVFAAQRELGSEKVEHAQRCRRVAIATRHVDQGDRRIVIALRIDDSGVLFF